MKYLGVDFGDVRTGLAISDSSGIIATPLGNIEEISIKKVAKAINDTATEKKAEVIVLGYPINMNNTKGVRAEKTEQLKEILENEYNLKVVLRDERLTTVSAHQILSSLDVSAKKRKSSVDTLSACLILQNYLDFLK
jgi:putative Holliday junction resolvase